jgi:hypothetical protein
MFGSFRHAGIAAAGFLGAAAAVWAGSGYLPNVGPIPLRFRPLASVSTNLVSLPAPLPWDSTDMDYEDMDASNAPQETVIPPLAGTNSNAPRAEIMEVSSAPAPAPAVDPVISPQMFIQYFRPTTNVPVTGAGTAVGFLPPPPPAGAPATKVAP